MNSGTRCKPGRVVNVHALIATGAKRPGLPRNPGHRCNHHPAQRRLTWLRSLTARNFLRRRIVGAEGGEAVPRHLEAFLYETFPALWLGFGHYVQLNFTLQHDASSCQLSGYPTVAAFVQTRAEAEGAAPVHAEQTPSGYLGSAVPANGAHAMLGWIGERPRARLLDLWGTAHGCTPTRDTTRNVADIYRPDCDRVERGPQSAAGPPADRRLKLTQDGPVRLLLIADTHIPKRARDLPAQVWDEVAKADVVHTRRRLGRTRSARQAGRQGGSTDRVLGKQRRTPP